MTRLYEVQVTAGENILTNKEKYHEKFNSKANTWMPKVGDRVRQKIEKHTNMTNISKHPFL